MPFTSRTISPNTLGRFLKKARLDRGYELREVEREIGISQKYLQAIEADEYYELPSSTYARGMLSRYGKFLGFFPEAILERWRKEFGQTDFVEDEDRSAPLFSLERNKFLAFFSTRNVVIMLAVLALFVYFGFEIRNLLAAPKIEIIAPKKDLVTDQLSLTVKGFATPQAQVFINNQSVNNADNGFFEQSLELVPGTNKIKISAQKKYSPESVVWRYVIVEE